MQVNKTLHTHTHTHTHIYIYIYIYLTFRYYCFQQFRFPTESDFITYILTIAVADEIETVIS
jgi:hypothetical protein